MNYDDIQFGDYDPEHDFSQDITGKFYQPSSNDNTDQLSDTGLPDNFWFQASSSSSIINNNDLPGTADDKFGETVKLNENRQVINKVYIMAMRGSNPFQLERMLKMTFSDDDFQNKPFLRSSLFILPMIGPVFWSCWAHRTEEDARQDLRRKTGLKPVLASKCSECSSCQFKNSISPKTTFCSKLGLPIFNNDFNSVPPSKVIAHLRIAGYLSDNKKDFTWDDIRKVIIFPPDNKTPLTYKQFGPSRKEVLPGAQYRKELLALNRMRYEQQAQKEQYDRNRFIHNVFNPLVIKVQESFLRNRQNDQAIKDYIQKILFPDNYRSECQQIITSLKDDILLWAGIRFYLPSYLKCDDALQFFRRSHLHIPYAIQRNDCAYCIDNKSSFCKRLECNLIGYRVAIPQTDRLQRIELIGSDHNINRQLIDYCKELEQSDPLTGLKKLREILRSPQVVSIYNGAGLQDLDPLSGKDVRKESVQAWVEKKLQEGSSILRIEKAVNEFYGSKKGIALIQYAIINLKTRPSDKNDLCLTDYQIDPSIKQKRLDKCTTCSYATTVHCRKYNQMFSESFMEVAPEFNEIMNMYHDSPKEIKIDPIKQSKPMNVEMKNPGETLDVDVQTEKSLDEQKLWEEAQSQEMEVEPPPGGEFEDYPDIDIGEPGEGMDLDDLV